MILNNKLVNESYLKEERYIMYIPNLRNKKYIDNWISRNYSKLYSKFNKNDYTITKKGYSKTDILHESIIRFYLKKEKYKNQIDCDNDMNEFFKL